MPVETQQQVSQQPRPDLPLDRLLVIADEVPELERLLEFLEEGLDGPARPVQFRDCARTPFEVVGDEGHLLVLAVHLDDGRDKAERAGILFSRALEGHAHRLIGDDAGILMFLLSGDIENHVVFRAQDKEDAAFPEAVQEGQIDIRLVCQQHIAVLQRRAQDAHVLGVVVRRVVHAGEGWQHIADVECQVRFCSGLLAAVPRPVDAVEREFERCGVDGEDVTLQPMKEPHVLLVLREGRADRLQVREHGPVELLGDVRVARAVGIGKRVALRCPRAADAVHLGFMQTKRVADLVQAGRSRKVPVEQSEDVAERAELPDVSPRLPREEVNDAIRNPLDNLTQRGVRCFRWLWGRSFVGADERVQPRLIMVVVFHAAVGYSRDRPQSQHFFFDLEIGAKKIIFGVDYFAPPA